LFVFGTSNIDNVRIDFREKDDVIEVKTNPAENEKQRFSTADVQLIHVVLGDGNDHATVARNIPVAAILVGGDGKDHLTVVEAARNCLVASAAGRWPFSSSGY